MKNNTHKFWIQHKESIKEHWPMVLVHVMLSIWLINFFMEQK